MTLTDAERDAQRERVKALFERWIGLIGLDRWKIKISYLAEGPIEGDDGSFALMTCTARWEYRKATITVALSECPALPDDELEQIVVHELMHIFLSEMREKDEDLKHEERVATMLAEGLIGLYKAPLAGELELVQ